MSPRKRFVHRYFHSDRLLALDECLQLWVEYVELFEAKRYEIPAAQVRQVRYEDLTSDSEKVLRDLFDHVRVEIGAAELADLAATVQPSRHRPMDAALGRLAAHPKLAELGYDE